MSSNNAHLMVGNRPLSSLRVVDLKQELEKRGLSKSGSKKDLVDRLRLHLQIEKHRDTGASADEEELPNYSQVHDELANQNPFIRDYLESQAELFHSQKVVKKLVEEEAKRESETSADESVDSPVKQPPKLESEASPVTETRRQSRRRNDSQREEMTAEQLVTRSSRSRLPAAATAPTANTEAKTNDVPVQNEPKQPEAENQSVSLDKPSVSPEKPSISPEKPSVSPENPSVSPEKQPVSPEKPPVSPGKPSISPEKPPVSPEKLPASSEKPSASPVKQSVTDKLSVTENQSKTIEEIKPCEVQVETHPALADKEREPERKYAACPVSNQPEPEEDTQPVIKSDEGSQIKPDKEVKEVPSVEEEKVEEESVSENISKSRSSSPQPVEKISEKINDNGINEKEERVDDNAQQEESMDIVDAKDDKKSRSSSPVADVTKLDSKSETSPAPKIQDVALDTPVITPKDKQDDSESSSEDEGSSRSRSRSRSRFRSKSRSRSRSNESRDDSQSRDGNEKKSEPEGNDEDSQEAPKIENERKDLISRSASRSPVREKTPEKSEVHKEEPEKKDETETKTIVEPDEKMEVEESLSPRYKSSQKETSYTNNDIAGEEALDYGEEEDDEDRNENDPQEFSWSRRSLRFKNKTPFAAPANKWKLEEECKHLVVKSKLLNSYYEDIKLVPLELLKLEDKATEASSETKKEIERKPSISKEAEPDEPLPTRTVENVAPTIKRTVSIIPSTKMPITDGPEESDKALTPPRNPPSDVLLITNLVRPFTLIQLKEMLQRTGNLQDIWVDKIKSKCIAKFGSQEEAFETRAALHGVCWPNSNPKSLHVDYTTQDNLEEHKAKEGAEQSITTEKPVSAQPVPVREWDVGKKEVPKSPNRNRKRSRSRSTSRDRNKRSRRSPSPGRRRRSKSPAHERRNRGGEGKEPEPMGKALDVLFRKTVATPSIYWLPLTPEQIAEKEELRRKRMLERERRLAELSKMRPNERR